jgi:hypothetical protein
MTNPQAAGACLVICPRLLPIYSQVPSTAGGCTSICNPRIRHAVPVALGGVKIGVFENRVLGRISGLKGNEVMEGWRKLHNKELHDLNFLPSIIRIIKLRWNVQNNTTKSVHVTNTSRPIIDTAYSNRNLVRFTQTLPHTCMTLTEVSPDRRYSLTLGKTVHSQATVPVTTTEQEPGIM